MKLIDVKQSLYLQKAMFQIGLNKFFLIKKVKNSVFSDLNREEIVGTFFEKELQKTTQKVFEILIKEKGNKLYVEWKGYDSFFNSWIIIKKTT